MRLFFSLSILTTLNSVSLTAQNQFPTTTNSNVELDGGYIKLIKPETSGGWARGLFFYNKKTDSEWAGIGLYGEAETVNSIYLGHGNDPWWNNNGIHILTNGNTGIGTNTPSSKLDVNGAIKLNGGNQGFSITEIDETDAPFGSFINYGGIAINGNDGNNRQMFMFTDGSNTQNVFTIATSQDAGTNWHARFIVQQNGYIGIGTTSPYYKLDVEGTIRAHEIKVNLNEGADFVFEEDYNLMPLNELETFVKTKKHLPEIVPAEQMEAEGLSLSEMNIKLLEKVEQLTLYTIEQQKAIETLLENNKKLTERIESLENKNL